MRVLFIDDEEPIRRIGDRVLRDHFEVELAATGSEAKEVFSRFRPKCVVSDFRLPDANGIDLVAEFKESDPTLRVLVISGHIPSESDRKKLPADASFLAKPFSPGELLKAVEGAIRRSPQPDDLSASEHRYRTLVERASDIIYETNELGFFIYANPVASRIAGRPLDELIGMRFTELIRPDKRPDAERFYYEQAAKGIANTYYEFPMEVPGRPEVWIGQNVQLLVQGGKIIGFQAVARDITQKIEADRFKDELLAVVSHELRTPLTAIRGALGLLGSGRLDAEKRERMTTVAIENCDRMTRLLNDFLDLERLRAGVVKPVIAEVDVDELVLDARAGIQVLADAAGVAVGVERRALGVEIAVDHDRMLQALVNLLTNAIKFSERGQRVYIEVASDEQFVRLTVRDEGRGIPEDRLCEIFEPFKQVDQSDAREKGGIGVGLPITKSIVELHGGTIEVQSEVGKGTAFTIVLPAR